MIRRVVAWFARERNRAYLYRVFASGGAVALFYGIASSDEIAVWSGAVATVFALPAVNTSTANPDKEN